MLETELAVDAAREILAVPDVAFGFVGPGDLSISSGHPLETDHPDVRSQVDRTERVAADVDASLGRIMTDFDETRAAIESGYRVFRIGVDTVEIPLKIAERLDAIQNRL